MRKRSGGFTLIELLVVVLIIGILSAFAVPQYTKSIENTKADDAAALLNMVGTANRMYALDHNGTYAAGALDNTCNSATCSATLSTPCNLVGCKYLAAMDFNAKPYKLWAGNGSCGDGGVAGMTGVACGRRRKSADGGSNYTDKTPYSGWGYAVDTGGVTTALGAAPTPTQ